MTDPKQGFDSVLATLQAIVPDGKDEKRLPPVHQWNPDNCGDIGMEIRRDGSWWHEGIRITRQPLVDLFATILRKDEDGATYLVTPYEKVIVHVEDAPFIAIRADRVGEGSGQTLAFTTNLGDMVIAGPDHPIRVETDPETLEPRPYVLIRGRLEARIARPPFYELAEWAEERDGCYGVWSRDTFFPIGPVAA